MRGADDVYAALSSDETEEEQDDTEEEEEEEEESAPLRVNSSSYSPEDDPTLPTPSCPAKAARWWRRHVDVWLVRLVFLVSASAALVVVAHIVDLGVVDRVHEEFHCLSPEARARAEALRPPPYEGDDPRTALLEKFKPVVFMHHKERYLPTSLEELLRTSSLEVYRDSRVQAGSLTPETLREYMAITPRVTVGDVEGHVSLVVRPESSALAGMPASELGGAPYYGQARLVCIRPGSRGGDLSDTCDRAIQGLPAGPFGACDQTRSPGRRPTPGRFWELRYSFLSANNGPQYILGVLPIGAHRGDLEHVTIRVADDRETVLDVYFGTHTTSEGRWFLPEFLDWFDGAGGSNGTRGGRHPVVYSALNSHASYPYCGTIRRRGFLRLAFPHDHADDSGPIWWPRRVVSVDSGGDQYGDLLRDYTGDLGSDFVAGITRQEWWCNENDYAIHRFPYVVGY